MEVMEYAVWYVSGITMFNDSLSLALSIFQFLFEIDIFYDAGLPLPP
jgi:hypothetical protein